MKLTQEQAKLVELTMELDLKTREYKKLCEEFDKIKNARENNLTLASLYEKFRQNQNDLSAIISKLNSLK